MTGIVVWITFFGYLFFPFKNFFNYQGRKYFFILLKECLIPPFVPTTFPISWLTDQLISLTGPIRDFEYTICYFLEYLEKKD
jgi:hypothetical protein